MSILTSRDTRYTSWLEIDLHTLARNYRILKARLGQSVSIVSIVKANAYGHGVKNVVSVALEEGVSMFGVATLQEAIELREAFADITIIVLDVNFTQDASCILEYNLQPIVYTHEMLAALNEAGKQWGRKVPVHLKIDTGMGRVGVWHEDAIQFISQAFSYEYISIVGICSHFAVAESDFSYSLAQWEAFAFIVDYFKNKGIVFPYYHLANSAGTFVSGLPVYNLVRLGIITYGIMPRRHNVNELGLEPILSWRTRVIYCKDVPKGRSIGYGCTYIAPHRTYIATVPIGYADGYLRSLSNKGVVLINGKRCNVVGRVAMDHIMVDVGSQAPVEVGAEVTLIGKQQGEIISCEELGELAGTIPYEITCNAGHRAQRIYIS
ncbi:MAG: alanine racemase [Candidatus Auribacterota bacterium]|jgi:alanine racemase|nr:alanine racemase [Candidatus Auribacterota bacterium]